MINWQVLLIANETKEGSEAFAVLREGSNFLKDFDYTFISNSLLSLRFLFSPEQLTHLELEFVFL